MRSESKAINRLTDVKSKVSSHYFIRRDGSIILMVPELYEAWHAGKSNWKKDKSLNKNSIGIEVSNKGHQFGYQNFTKKQINSLIKLSKYLIKKYNIKKTNILGHSDIAYERKKDPGEKFPWKFLAKKNIGVWHKLKSNECKKNRNKKISEDDTVFFNKLKKFGYKIEGLDKKGQKKLIKNFQRRFRPELVNGKIDLECFEILNSLI